MVLHGVYPPYTWDTLEDNFPLFTLGLLDGPSPPPPPVDVLFRVVKFGPHTLSPLPLMLALERQATVRGYQS